MSDNLSALEVEVQQARGKLTQDLALLRSPQTYRQLGAGLKSEAQSVAQRVWDDLKARAAANPTASLAIGAGIAWRLMKHPPIATALIGAGILGLWRTAPIRVDDEDYFSAAQQRLGEQVTETVDTIRDYAAEKVVATREKAGAYAQSTRETVEGLATSVAEEAAAGIENARETVKRLPDKAVHVAQRATSELGRAVSDEAIRDNLLLGVAGLAVAAAVGLAYQRRANDELVEWQ
jgi:ElaB/YqjD/DUF883 family membrane-anchored ribosome-binding protein